MITVPIQKIAIIKIMFNNTDETWAETWRRYYPSKEDAQKNADRLNKPLDFYGSDGVFVVETEPSTERSSEWKRRK